MPYRSKDLKAPAWSAMRAAVPSAVLVTLVYYLLSTALPSVITYLIPTITLDDLIYNWSAWVWISLFLSVLLTLFQMVMEFGYQGWALRTARREQAGVGELLDGFGMVGRVLLMNVQIILRLICWTIGITVVYTILIYAIAFILYLDPYVLIGILVLLIVSLYAVIFAVMLRYELAPFLLYDYPEAGSGAAVRRSVEMTRGHKWELFKLYLSFWPWYLASLLIAVLVSGFVLAPSLGELAALISSGNVDMAVSQAQLALNGTLSTFLSMVLALPLELFFLPYRRISVANFYRALSQESVGPAFSGESF